MYIYDYVVFFFFFQAEDGIRDVAVTGVQTCALPILPLLPALVAVMVAAPTATPVTKPVGATVASAGVLDVQLTDRPGSTLPAESRDRKSTRLNSSHGYISYAVFCLKKKKIYLISRHIRL